MAHKQESVKKFLSTLRDIYPEVYLKLEMKRSLTYSQTINGIKRHTSFKKSLARNFQGDIFFHYLVEELGMPFVKSSTMSIRKR